MPAYVDTGLNFVAVEDVAKGHWLAAEHGQVGARYILGDRNLTLKQMLEILSTLSGRPMPRLRLPHAVPFLAALADSLAARLLGRSRVFPWKGCAWPGTRCLWIVPRPDANWGFDLARWKQPWSAPFAGTAIVATVKERLVDRAARECAA